MCIDGSTHPSQKLDPPQKKKKQTNKQTNGAHFKTWPPGLLGLGRVIKFLAHVRTDLIRSRSRQSCANKMSTDSLISCLLLLAFFIKSSSGKKRDILNALIQSCASTDAILLDSLH